MRFLVTGGAGFIGRRLCDLLKQAHEVTVFDNFLAQVHGQEPVVSKMLDGVRVVRGDVRDPEAIAAVVKQANPDRIFHLAAETGTGQSFDEPTRYNGVNIMGTSHLVDAVRQAGPNVDRIVIAGSRSVYGEGACVDATGKIAPAIPRLAQDMASGVFSPRSADGVLLSPIATNAQNCPPNPASVYASTKLFQEQLLQQCFWGTSVDVGVLRLQNVYGPGQSLSNPYTGVISIFRSQINAGKVLEIYEDGDIVRDFVYVDDVARAFALMGLNAQCPRQICDIGSGEPTKIIEMARLLLSLMGRSPEMLRVSGGYRAGDVRHAVADISEAARALHWTPEVRFAEGLRRFLEWDGLASI